MIHIHSSGWWNPFCPLIKHVGMKYAFPHPHPISWLNDWGILLKHQSDLQKDGFHGAQ